MDLGIIIYSQTGNTRYVAGKLKEKLEAEGHRAEIKEIKISGSTPAQAGKFEITDAPAPDGYDAVIFGSPVQAFSLNPVMKAYLAQLPSLENKKVACFVTKQLPLVQTGGTGAVARMKKECESRGAAVLGTEIVVWSKSKRDRSVNKCVEELSRLF